MSENGKMKEEVKEDWIRFRVDPSMKKEWVALCQKRGESEAELGRKLVLNAISQGGVESGLDEIIAIIRNNMKDVMKPMEERLAAINAKTAIASATSMYMNTQVIANAGQDAVSIYDESRKKAVNFVKSKVNS